MTSGEIIKANNNDSKYSEESQEAKSDSIKKLLKEVHNTRYSCSKVKHPNEDLRIKSKIEELLPSEYEYIVQKYLDLPSRETVGAPPAFKATVLTNIVNESEVANFIKRYGEKTKETLQLRMRKNNQNVHEKCLTKFKESFRCQHNTRSHTNTWDPQKGAKTLISLLH